ncbi:MAG: TonB-dependent receptor [Gemmatimonas sp.]|nr:TonB-dependent receptor [Gemmatimonas sp.]
MEQRANRLAFWCVARVGVAALVAVSLNVGVGVAQEGTGRIQGQVIGEETGQPLQGVRVYVDGTTRGDLTDPQGRFVVAGVPAGQRVVVFEFIGRGSVRQAVEVGPGEQVDLDVRLGIEALPIDDVVVSATREMQSLAETAASVGIVQSSEIRETLPAHPSEIMGKIPGVWVNVTGGEGHATAIRQPLTTDPVYLYLEDGVPTRSTGFFNHNALYEINLPQAERIEVIKGPATALYGSDAIGGTINVETRPAVAAPGLDATLEGGSHGFMRLLGSYAFTSGDNGVRTDANVTRTDGWRDGTAYDRQSGTIRWDRVIGDGQTVKAVAAASRVDQQTAGTSRLPEEAYLETPTMNLTPISFRDVGAARVSVEYERVSGSSLLTLTPFARHNSMDLLPNWSLTYDPTVYETSNQSIGFLSKYRRDFSEMNARLIVGLDVDWSPGKRYEQTIEPVQSGSIFTDYTPGAAIYDYDVTFTGLSPYVHLEGSPLERLRVTAGLRFDRLGYDYENHLGELTTGQHRRPGSTSVSYTELSPHLGAAYDLGFSSIFVSYGQGFRAPSEGQIFRQGVALNTIDLEPVKATNYEAGFRGSIGGRLSYEAAAYYMEKTNDVLTFQRSDDERETQNAGATLHRGVEVGFGVSLPANLTFQTAVSYAKHTYEDWEPNETTDYSGKEMEVAPRRMGNTTLAWAPGGERSPRVELEWVHLGSYWLTPANERKYDGHNLLNLTTTVPVTRNVRLVGKLNNVTDERYAEAAAFSAFRGVELAPGLPRTFFVGGQIQIGG